MKGVRQADCDLGRSGRKGSEADDFARRIHEHSVVGVTSASSNRVNARATESSSVRRNSLPGATIATSSSSLISRGRANSSLSSCDSSSTRADVDSDEPSTTTIVESDCSSTNTDDLPEGRYQSAKDGQQQSPLIRNSFYLDGPSWDKVDHSLEAGTERPLKAGITRGRRIMGTSKSCRGGENRGPVISRPEVRPKKRAARKGKRILRPGRLCSATITAGEDSIKDTVRSGRKDGRGSDYGSSRDYSRLRRHWRNERKDRGGLGLAGATQGRALLTDDESPDDSAKVRVQVLLRNFIQGVAEPKVNRQHRRKSIAPRPSLTRKGWGSGGARTDSSGQPYRAYEVAAKPAAPSKVVRKGITNAQNSGAPPSGDTPGSRRKESGNNSVLRVMATTAKRGALRRLQPREKKPLGGAVRAGTQIVGKAARPTKNVPRLSPRAQPKKASRPTSTATSPMSEQGAESDAYLDDETDSSEVNAPQINPLDAKKARNERAMSRLRPRWWGPRVEGAYTRIMKLRPTNHLLSPSLAAETSPQCGAFLVEPLKLGPCVIPAGARLIEVGDTPSRDMPFDEIVSIALAGSAGTKLVFE